MNPSGLDGHIPRNIRLLLKLIELVEPDVLLMRPPQFSRSSKNPNQGNIPIELSMALLPIGCRHVDSLELILLKQSCDSVVQLRQNLTDVSFSLPPNIGRSIPLISSTIECGSIGIWENWEMDPTTLRWTDHSFERQGKKKKKLISHTPTHHSL